MKKISAIKTLMDGLLSRHPDWRIVDPWDADLAAIGFAKEGEPGRLVYVSVDDLPGYYYECEVSTGGNDDEFRTAQSGRASSVDEIEEIVHRHLK